jgi:hypothetical protein
MMKSRHIQKCNHLRSPGECKGQGPAPTVVKICVECARPSCRMYTGVGDSTYAPQLLMRRKDDERRPMPKSSTPEVDPAINAAAIAPYTETERIRTNAAGAAPAEGKEMPRQKIDASLEHVHVSLRTLHVH